MIEKVSEFYQTKKSERCPGEKNCERFQSASGKTREEKEFNACVGPANLTAPICNLYSSKPKTKNFENLKKADQIIDRVFGIRRRKQSDNNFDLGQITPLEYELLLLMDETFENFERNLRLSAIDNFQSMIEVLIKRLN